MYSIVSVASTMSIASQAEASCAVAVEPLAADTGAACELLLKFGEQ